MAANETLRTELTLYGEVTIYLPNGEIAYRGKPDGYSVDSACPTPGGNVVALLNCAEKKTGAFNNLLLLSSEGSIIWRAELPDTSPSNAYVEFKFDDGRLIANSWSAHHVEINLDNGKLLKKTFTK